MWSEDAMAQYVNDVPKPVACFRVLSRATPEHAFRDEDIKLDIWPNWNGFIGRSSDWYLTIDIRVVISTDLDI